MQTSSPHSSLMLLAAVLFIAVAILCLKWGRWPRRVGSTPHCPRCDYIVSLEQGRCPECGTLANPRNVIRGERHRRTSLIAIGTAFSLLGLGMLGLTVAGFQPTFDWNRHKPASWLLKDLSSTRASVRDVAWTEIARRRDAKLLSDRDQDAVVVKGLELQASGVSMPSSSNILDLIAQRYLDGKLTSTQADQFFAGAMRVKLSVRPIVGTLSPIPYLIGGFGRGPHGWWMRMRTLESQLDEAPVEKIGGGSSGGFDGWTTSSTLPPVAKMGKHRLRVRVELAINATPRSRVWDDDAVAVKHFTQDLVGDFQVVDGQTPIAVATEPVPELLRPLLTAQLTLDPRSPQTLSAMVQAAALPVDVAFDVFVRFAGHEYSVGAVSFHQGSPGGYGTSTRDFPAAVPDAVDVIFRSSQAVARGTVNMTRIWKGELVLKDVPLVRPPPSATTQAAPTILP